MLSTITVTNADDSGAGSLRQAIIDAQDGDPINFDSSLQGADIKLTSGELDISHDITIEGLGEDQLSIDGQGMSREFDILAVA